MIKLYWGLGGGTYKCGMIVVVVIVEMVMMVEVAAVVVVDVKEG